MEVQIQQLIEQLFQVLRTILDSTPPLLAQAEESLQLAFDVCIGTRDGFQSPVPRLVRKLFPELFRPT